ncbi:MAG: MarR family transcriptional regulator [Coprothermobacterota bacterium]|nr:MarR family transcriptional regulator [Coprothermobacterota bacterium]
MLHNNEIEEKDSPPENLVDLLEKWSACFSRRAMQDALAVAHSAGLTLPSLYLLIHLADHQGAEIGHLRRFMHGSSADASQKVERLVQLGLLQRSEDPRDRRVRTVCLTTEGQRIIQQTIVRRRQWLSVVMAGLSLQEQAESASALCSLVRQAQSLSKQDFDSYQETDGKDLS